MAAIPVPSTATGTGVSTLGVAPSGIDIDSKKLMKASDSWFGFRRAEKLGKDWTVIWQIEGNVGVDNGTGTIAGRNTHLAVIGALGTLRFGKIDTDSV